MPSLHSDEAVEDFVATADLARYDLSGFKPMRFEIEQRWSPFFGQGDKLSSGLNEDGFYGQGYAETVCGRVQVTGCAGGDPWGTDAGGTGFETWRASDDDRPMEAPGDRRHGKPFFW
nr:BrnA antitoxin family protein [Komagataeibacter rhaeticus]